MRAQETSREVVDGIPVVHYGELSKHNTMWLIYTVYTSTNGRKTGCGSTKTVEGSIEKAKKAVALGMTNVEVHMRPIAGWL